MKECDIARDLMPLYAEELTSPGSRDFLEGHLEKCEACRAVWQRHLSAMPELELREDYKKPLEESVMKIVLQTIGAVLAVLLVMVYLGWEMRYFCEVKQMKAPDGGSNFKVFYYDDDGFFITGGAEVVLPNGTSRNLRGDETFVDLEVYWAPDSRAYFAVWSFTDHQEVYYVNYDDIDAAGGWRNYLDNRDLYAENFYEELTTMCRQQGILVEEIGFSHWSRDSRDMVFHYFGADGQRGEITYSLEQEAILDITE